MLEVWVDKHAPKSLDEYVFQDEEIINLINRWIAAGATDNVLLVGPPGVGKTTLFHLLTDALEVPDYNRMYMNAPRDGGIETVRKRIIPFVQSGGFDGLKYVCIDEANGLSLAAQETLKSDMEMYMPAARWFLTTNKRSAIDPAVQERTTVLELTAPDKDAYTARMAEILEQEGVSLETDEDLEALATIIDRHYPSLRACIRALERYSVNGKLALPKIGSTDDWILDVITTIKNGDINGARKLAVESVSDAGIVEVYRWLVSHSSLFKDEDAAVITLARAVVNHTAAADTEIHLAGVLTELVQENGLQ